MTPPGTVAWFAQHEWRLAWRDWIWLLSGGRRRRGHRIALGLLIFALFLHGVAYLTLAGSAAALAAPPDKRMLLVITGISAMYGSLMLSQAMEAVTRAFYGRGDLDLILSSPTIAWRLFAVRIVAMAVTIMLMSVALAAPFIDVLVWLGGARWLGAYGVAAALAMGAVAVAVALTAALFRTIGPKRTRFVAQIVAAVVGASFVIGVQFGAVFSLGTLSRIALFQSNVLIAYAPDKSSALWLPANAMLGDWRALAVVLGAGAIALTAAVYCYAPQFGRFALAAASVSYGSAPRKQGRNLALHAGSPGQALRRKEWILLWRDPWLISQSLMQLLYLLPAMFLLWRSFYHEGGGGPLLVPVLVMAAGQLAGGLAWLAISGEDAPDLVASAPVTARRILRAKVEAVMGAIAIIFGPFIIALAFLDFTSGLAGFIGIAIAAGSATLIQFWFRAQAKRSQFRRRQVSSRVATVAEALSSITWAGVGALAAARAGLAFIPAIVAVAILGGTWTISPARSGARPSRRRQLGVARAPAE
jgi:ABC-2 type transport system permease protein